MFLVTLNTGAEFHVDAEAFNVEGEDVMFTNAVTIHSDPKTKLPVTLILNPVFFVKRENVHTIGKVGAVKPIERNVYGKIDKLIDITRLD